MSLKLHNLFFEISLKTWAGLKIYALDTGKSLYIECLTVLNSDYLFAKYKIRTMLANCFLVWLVCYKIEGNLPISLGLLTLLLHSIFVYTTNILYCLPFYLWFFLAWWILLQIFCQLHLSLHSNISWCIVAGHGRGRVRGSGGRGRGQGFTSDGRVQVQATAWTKFWRYYFGF